MIQAVILWAMCNRLTVCCGALLAALLGLRGLLALPVDAIPDLGENQVMVLSDWPGRGTPEVDTQITRPLSLGLQGLRGVKTVRASSLFGFSLVTVVFDDRLPAAQMRQSVSERLNALSGKLPSGVTPTLGPEATGLGWMFQYYLAMDPAQAMHGGTDLAELRTLQDSLIGPQLGAVDGVAEVASVGGFVKQYQIEMDSAKMHAAEITMSALLDAVSANNLNVGGNTIEENGMEFVVRGVGVLRGVEDIESIVLPGKGGVAVRLKDLARVSVGGDFRRGALDVAGHEVVGGIVVMRTGENAREVIGRVKAKIVTLQDSLPEGITIKVYYDRSTLIDSTLGTLQRTLWEEDAARSPRAHNLPLAFP